MADLNLKSIEYLDRDFESILDSMVNQIPNLTTKWTDFNSSDVGMVLLELLSFSLENLHFYMDNQANEAFLSTARQRKNVIKLCQLLSYKLSGVVSSTTLLKFSLPSPYAYTIEIPKYTRVSTTGTEDTIYFTTSETLILTAGDVEGYVTARQGIPKTESFASHGNPNQKFRLSEKLIDKISIEVEINNTVWTQVETFMSSVSSDRVYTVEIDGDGYLNVILGDGYFGYFPTFSPTKNVNITYLVSDGSAGNVGSGSITTILDEIYDVIGGQPSDLSVVNTQAATGGDDEETIEHAKRQAPAEFSAQFRAVTKHDFIAYSNGYPGIGKANVWGEQESSPPNYHLQNWVMVVAAPENVTREALVDDVDNGELSDALQRDLLDYLYSKAPITTRIKVLQPEYIPIDLEIDVFYYKNALSSVVKSGVEESISESFSFDQVEFGKELRLSNLYKLVDSVDGVSHSRVTLFDAEFSDEIVDGLGDGTVVMKHHQIPFLRNLTISISKATQSPTISTLYPQPPEAPVPDFIG